VYIIKLLKLSQLNYSICLISSFNSKDPIEFDMVNFKIVPACLSDGTEKYESEIAWATGYGALKSGSYCFEFSN
jgi:hypothetical protein